jgi:hypothetical protein
MPAPRSESHPNAGPVSTIRTFDQARVVIPELHRNRIMPQTDKSFNLVKPDFDHEHPLTIEIPQGAGMSGRGGLLFVGIRWQNQINWFLAERTIQVIFKI